MMRIELMTPFLPRKCSATEPHRHVEQENYNKGDIEIVLAK